MESSTQLRHAPSTGKWRIISATEFLAHFQFDSSDDDLRIIRPIIFIRERIFEDFSMQKHLPTRPSKIFSRSPEGAQSILQVQEIINPNVYDNIKNAVYPLLLQNYNHHKH
jgi:hypothetical protein